MTMLAMLKTWPDLGYALLDMVIFGLVGIGLMILGFKAFDWITPRVDVERELAERHNVAVAVVVAAVLLGIAGIVITAMIS